jgi:hypothetical protein
MKKHILFLSFLLFSVFAFSQKDRDPGTYNYEIQFLRTGVEGTELFKIFTYCKKEKDCFDFAKVDAIKAILFKGIPGSGLQRPMIPEAGAEDKYRDYFIEFFKPGGKYLNFVAISNDGSISEDDRFKVGKNLKIGIIISVQKANLRRELEAAGIVKPLSSGF